MKNKINTETKIKKTTLNRSFNGQQEHSCRLNRQLQLPGAFAKSNDVSIIIDKPLIACCRWNDA
jgi:hypothetical protein